MTAPPALPEPPWPPGPPGSPGPPPVEPMPAPPPAQPASAELPPPADPWAQGAPGEAYPQIIYFERRRRWPTVVLTLSILAAVAATAGIWVTAPLRAQWPAHFTIPRGDQVAGLTIVPGHEDQVADFERQIRDEFVVSDAYAAVLEDPNSPTKPIVFFAATGLILTPARDLTREMRKISKGSRIEDFPPGPLGGHLRCGGFTSDDANVVVVCGWIDHGSVGVTICFDERPVDDCAAKLRAIRAALVTRD